MPFEHQFVQFNHDFDAEQFIWFVLRPRAVDQGLSSLQC
jgi:hypothetical protein